jgi:hypothetical protein
VGVRHQPGRSPTGDWEFVTDDPSTVDRGKNTRVTWAATVFAALFDPCVHFATEITLRRR